MIYRPLTDYEAVVAGLCWSDNPYEDLGPENPTAPMGLDTLLSEPLTSAHKQFCSEHWAVVRGPIEKTGDVFQSFNHGDIVVSDRVA